MQILLLLTQNTIRFEEPNDGSFFKIMSYVL